MTGPGRLMNVGLRPTCSSSAQFVKSKIQGPNLGLTHDREKFRKETNIITVDLQAGQKQSMKADGFH